MVNYLLTLFRQTDTLLDRHFALRSSLHSRQLFQCALLLQHPAIGASVCGQLADKLRGIECDAVISPALGGEVGGVGVGVIVDRSDGAHPDFGCPFVSLVALRVETFTADKVSADLAAIPAVKPGSKCSSGSRLNVRRRAIAVVSALAQRTRRPPA